jgi:hypothetical protein
MVPLARLAASACLLALVAAAGASAMSLGACVDAEHQIEIQALGPEQPGVPKGPDHRPGQPCVTCHGGSGPASLQFSAGGTVYQYANETSQPAVDALVQIEDVDGKTWTVKTNTVGNFFVTVQDFQPHYPTKMLVTSADGTSSEQMISIVNRDGSCADCHRSSIGPSSAGPIYVQFAPSDGGM